MPNAYIGAGIAQGASAAYAAHRDQPDRAIRRREAEARAQTSEAQLAEYQANAPVRNAQRDNELVKLEATTHQTNSALAKQQTFEAFKMFDVDADPRHLNNWLAQSKNNPVSQNITAGMTRLDRVTRTPESEQLLRQQGIQDLDGFFSDPELSKAYVMGTKPDGSQSLVDMQRMQQMTGYADYTTNESRKTMELNSQVMQQMRAGGDLASIKADDKAVTQLAEVMKLPRAEVYKMLKEKPEASTGRGSTSMLERVASELRTANPDLGYRESMVNAVELTKSKTISKGTNETAFVQQYQTDNPEATYEQAIEAYRTAGRDQRTTTQKDLGYAEEAKVLLDKSFGGSFLDADISKLSTSQQAEMAQYVNRIEQAGGLELSTEEKKSARAVRKLLGVARTAGEELSADQTGPIDSMLRSVKSYISDNVDGKDSTVAYESFRAIARNALFGSQVSGADYKAFNSAVSTLGHQTGPVLVSLRTQLEMMRDDMQAMTDLNDPYVAKARFGVGLDELDDITDAIQDRIDIISNINAGKAVPGIIMPKDKAPESGIEVKVAPAGEQPKADRPSLDTIFGGAR